MVVAEGSALPKGTCLEVQEGGSTSVSRGLGYLPDIQRYMKSELTDICQ